MTMICLCLALFAKAEATDVSQIDNTIYIVRTSFNDNSNLTVYDTVERITSKAI